MPATFQFSRPRELASDVSSSDSQLRLDDDVHPIEQVVQSIVGSSLDALNSKLLELQQSQVILVSRIRLLESKLVEIDQNISIANANLLVSRANTLRSRLAGVLALLQTIQRRVTNMKASASLE